MEKTISNLLHRDFHNHFSKVIVNSTENNASNLSNAVSMKRCIIFFGTEIAHVWHSRVLHGWYPLRVKQNNQ